MRNSSNEYPFPGVAPPAYNSSISAKTFPKLTLLCWAIQWPALSISLRCRFLGKTASLESWHISGSKNKRLPTLLCFAQKGEGGQVAESGWMVFSLCRVDTRGAVGAVFEDCLEEVPSKAALKDGAGQWVPLCLCWLAGSVSTAECSRQVTLGQRHLTSLDGSFHILCPMSATMY